MESGRRSRDGSPDMRIRRLIPLKVDRLRFAVQIRRNRHFAATVQHIGEQLTPLPAELDDAGLAFAGHQVRRQIQGRHMGIVSRIGKAQSVILPALCVPDHTFPPADFAGCKNGIVFRWIDGFQAEDFDMGSRVPSKKQACRHDLGIVEHHDGVSGNQVG